MKKIIFFILIINLILIPILGQTEENIQKFKISAVSDLKEVPLNKQFNVTVTISYIGTPGEYVISEPYVENYNNMILMGNSTENVIKNSTENSNLKVVEKKYSYILKPESLGQAYFPIVRVSIGDAKGKLITELNTQAIPISIIEPVIQRNYKPLLIILLIVLLLGALGFAGYRYYQTQQQKKEEKLKQEEALKLQNQTPEKEFNDEFNKLDLSDAFEKLNVSVNLLKNYYEKKFKIKIKDKSTSQILKLFKDQQILPEDAIDKINKILHHIDRIKFGAEEKNEKVIVELIEGLKNMVGV